jgi:hypothetical protein
MLRVTTETFGPDGSTTIEGLTESQSNPWSDEYAAGPTAIRLPAVAGMVDLNMLQSYIHISYSYVFYRL